MTLARTSVARSRYRSFTTGPPSIIRSSILTGKPFTRPAARMFPLSRFLPSWSGGGNFTDWKNSSGNLIPIYMPGMQRYLSKPLRSRVSIRTTRVHQPRVPLP